MLWLKHVEHGPDGHASDRQWRGIPEFLIALVFSMLGLGGGMLNVPVFKWLELPLKTVAIPLGLLLNGVTSPCNPNP